MAHATSQSYRPWYEYGDLDVAIDSSVTAQRGVQWKGGQGSSRGTLRCASTRAGQHASLTPGVYITLCANSGVDRFVASSTAGVLLSAPSDSVGLEEETGPRPVAPADAREIDAPFHRGRLSQSREPWTWPWEHAVHFATPSRAVPVLVDMSSLIYHARPRLTPHYSRVGKFVSRNVAACFSLGVHFDKRIARRRRGHYFGSIHTPTLTVQDSPMLPEG